MNTLKTAIDQLFTLAALALAFLAWNYITHGHGLHPFISLPAATLVALVPYYFNTEK
jgi:hypothetical protein